MDIGKTNWLWRRSIIFGIALTTMQVAGCNELSIGGKTARDVFTDPRTSALVEAACHGDLAKIDELVKRGADVNATGYRDMSVLGWTMACHDHEGAKRLLELGANPNYVMHGSDDISPMWVAAGSNDPYWLPLMLKHGGNPNIWCGADSALMTAMEKDRNQNFQLLLDHGADINAHDSGGNTVAMYAAALAKFDVVEMLLRRGYNYNLQTLAIGINGRIVSQDVAYEKQRVLKMLKERGVKFPLPPPQPASPPSRIPSH